MQEIKKFRMRKKMIVEINNLIGTSADMDIVYAALYAYNVNK